LNNWWKKKRLQKKAITKKARQGMKCLIDVSQTFISLQYKYGHQISLSVFRLQVCKNAGAKCISKQGLRLYCVTVILGNAQCVGVFAIIIAVLAFVQAAGFWGITTLCWGLSLPMHSMLTEKYWAVTWMT
jgi:hypothetical protein